MDQIFGFMTTVEFRCREIENLTIKLNLVHKTKQRIKYSVKNNKEKSRNSSTKVFIGIQKIT